MGRMSRNKGALGEREIVRAAKAHGFTAARTLGGARQRLSDIVGIPGFAVEVKREEREAVRRWFDQAADSCGDLTPMVAHRKNNTRWLATLDLDDLLALIKAAQS